MLQHLRAGDRSLLVHVADDKDGDPLPFRQLHQGHGTLLHLGDASRPRADIPVIEGLNGVHDEHIGLEAVDCVQHVFQVRFRQEIEPLAGHVQPLGPQLDLPL